MHLERNLLLLYFNRNATSYGIRIFHLFPYTESNFKPEYFIWSKNYMNTQALMPSPCSKASCKWWKVQQVMPVAKLHLLTYFPNTRTDLGEYMRLLGTNRNAYCIKKCRFVSTFLTQKIYFIYQLTFFRKKIEVTGTYLPNVSGSQRHMTPTIMARTPHETRTSPGTARSYRRRKYTNQSKYMILVKEFTLQCLDSPGLLL